METIDTSFFADEREAETSTTVGDERPRSDVHGHVTGRTQFYADRHFPGMLHLKMVRSPPSCADQARSTSRRREGAGRRARAHATRTCRATSTRSSA